MKLAHLYVSRVGANMRQTFAAALAGLALSHTIGVAVVKGLFTRERAVLPHAEDEAAALSVRKELAAAASGNAAFCVLLLAATVGLTRQIQAGPKGSSSASQRS